MKKILCVVTGGRIEDIEFLRSKLKDLNPEGIICADSGAGHMYALGLIPDIILGDMDSLIPEIENYFEKQGCRIVRYPEGKDETDTQLALDYAFGMNPDEVHVFGAFGSRIDHVLANISLLVLGAKRCVQVKLVDEWCEVFVVKDECTIDGEAGQTVSLLPISDMVTGINLDGFEYPLTGGVMEIGTPYGISNRLIAERGTISIKSGYLLVVRYYHAGVFP